MYFLDFCNETILGIWPVLFIVVFIFEIVRYFQVSVNREKTLLHKEVVSILFISYVIILSNIISSSDYGSVQGFNLIPFKEILRYTVGSNLFYLNVVGNIVIFLPLGYFVGLFLHDKKASHTVTLALLVSSFGEIIQYNIGRTLDIDDILLNTFGTLIGLYIYKILKKAPKVFQNDGLYNVLCIIILLAFLLYCLNVIGVVNII